MRLPLTFSARVVSGAGRGKDIGYPTINMDLDDVPAELDEGIYACTVRVDDQAVKAAMHLGPRPVFEDGNACEVHLIDHAIAVAPAELMVTVVAYLREVRDFPTVTHLTEQIAHDIEQVRAILDGNI